MTTKQNNLLLLFGMPRSGTTWLSKIIDSHPDVIYRHEPDSEHKLSLPIMAIDNIDYSKELQQFRQQLPQYRSAKTCGKAPFFTKSYFNPITFNLFKISVRLAKLAKQFNVNLKVLEIIQDTPHDLTILWKSIESVGRIQAIMQAMPEAKMIFIIRHPCGQIASTLRGDHHRKFTSQLAADEDYGIYEQLLKKDYAKQRGLTLSYIKSLNAIQRLALRWVLYNEHALKTLEKYPSRTLVVRYGDVCNDPITKAKEIFQFANLSWTTQSEAFLTTSVTKNEEAYYSVFKNPDTAMNCWKTELSDSNISEIANIIADSRAGQYYNHDFYS